MRDEVDTIGAGVQAVRHLRATRIGVEARAVTTIAADRTDLYQALRRLDLLGRVLTHAAIDAVTDTTSRWRVDAGAGVGVALEWLADLTEDVPGARLGWRSRPGSPVVQAGTVVLRDAPDGTEVELALAYRHVRGSLHRYSSAVLAGELDRLAALTRAGGLTARDLAA